MKSIPTYQPASSINPIIVCLIFVLITEWVFTSVRLLHPQWQPVAHQPILHSWPKQQISSGSSSSKHHRVSLNQNARCSWQINGDKAELRAAAAAWAQQQTRVCALCFLVGYHHHNNHYLLYIKRLAVADGTYYHHQSTQISLHTRGIRISAANAKQLLFKTDLQQMENIEWNLFVFVVLSSSSSSTSAASTTSQHRRILLITSLLHLNLVARKPYRIFLLH